MFDDEVICLNPRKKEETARPVRRPRRYDNRISVNELQDLNDLLQFDKWYNEKYSKTLHLVDKTKNHTKKI